MDRLLRNNKIVLLIAFILSLLLWFSVRGSTNTEGMISPTADYAALELPVTITNVSDQVTIANPHPTVTLTLRGDQWSLLEARVSPSSIHCIVDAKGYRFAGTFDVPVSITGLPKGVTVDRTLVSITFLANTSKDFKIDLTPEGNLPDGYVVGSLQVQPDKVTLKGPASAIASVRKVTAVLPLQKSDTGTFTRTVPVRAINDIGQPVEQVLVYPPIVNVTVEAKKPTQTLPVKVQTNGMTKAGFAIDSISTDPPTVEVLGDIGTMDSYPVPTLDVSGLSADKTFHVQLAPIPGITQITPSKITVMIHVEPAVKKTIPAIPIQVTGVPEGYTAKLSMPTMDVNLEGSKQSIDAVQNSDVILSVDLSTIVPNSPSQQAVVPIQVIAPSNIRTILPAGTKVNVILNQKDAVTASQNSTNTLSTNTSSGNTLSTNGT